VTQHLGFGRAEHALGRRVQLDNPALFVQRQQSVGHVGKDCLNLVLLALNLLERRFQAPGHAVEHLAELADFVEKNEPEPISYNVYLSDDGSRMTVMHVHPNSASLDFHLEVAGPLFGRFAGLLTLQSIDIYGEPSDKALAQLRDKVQLLGSGEVTVHPLHAGFSRFGRTQ
jgi:hypothetical protein